MIALHGFRDDSYDFNVAMITLSNSDGPGRRTQSGKALSYITHYRREVRSGVDLQLWIR